MPGARRALAESLAAGNVGVARIPGKHGQDRRFSQIVVMVDDRPGELGRLLSEIGEVGVNMEDLRLEHSPGAPIGLAEISVLPEVGGPPGHRAGSPRLADRRGMAVTGAQIVVAVDGPAGSGKSSVSRAAARRLGFDYQDSGAAYRALAWHALRARRRHWTTRTPSLASLDDFDYHIGTDPDHYFVRVGDDGRHHGHPRAPGDRRGEPRRADSRGARAPRAAVPRRHRRQRQTGHHHRGPRHHHRRRTGCAVCGFCSPHPSRLE